MRTPITYYGGKQSLLKYLLELVPRHRIYCEPFFGGGAMFFAKPRSEVEVINDINGEVINLYRVMKTKFSALQKEVKATLHSRKAYQHAMIVYENPELFSDVKRAWALWTAANQGFAGLIGSWGFGKQPSKERALAIKREEFTKAYAERLKSVQIEHSNALRVLARCDAPDAFLYCDPPYIGSDQGHYSGYTEQDYRDLLDFLSEAKGKFLLSSYPSKILAEYIRKNKWQARKVTKAVAVTKLTSKRKTEMLVYNYDAEAERQVLETKTMSIELESKLKDLKFAA